MAGGGEIQRVRGRAMPLSMPAAADEFSAPAAALKSLAADLSSLGSQTASWADTAASNEGKRAGAVAGTQDGYAPLRLNTLYAESYDASGNRAFLNRQETSARGELMNAALEHGDEPAAMKAASDAIRKKYSVLAARTAPELQGDLDATLQRTADAYVFSAGKEFRDKQEREARENFVIATAQRQADLQRRAVMGAGNPKLGESIEADQARLDKDIDARDDLTPAQKYKLKASTRGAVIGSLIEGQVEIATTPADLDRIETAYKNAWANKKGAVGQLSPDAYGEGLTAIALRRAQLVKAENAATKELTGTFDEIKQRVLDGEPIDATRWAAARARLQVGDKDGAIAGQMDDLARMRNWGMTFRGLSVGDQRATVAALDEKRIRSGLDDAERDRLTLARKVLGERETDEKADPLGSAPKNIGLRVDKIDWNGPSFEDQARRRIVQAEQVAKEKGTAVVYLERADKDRFKQLIDADPENAVSVGQRLMRSFGAKAPLVMRELSTEMPSLAYILRPENPDLAASWAKAAKAEQEGVTFGAKPSQANIIDVMKRQKWADLFVGREAEMAKLANAAAPVIAQRLGVGESKFDPHTTRHRTVAEDVLRDMLGRKKSADGKDQGGPAEVNSMATVAPSTLNPDNFQRVVRIVTKADLEETGIRPMAGGKALPIGEVTAAKWVPVAKDRYRLSLGDPRQGVAGFVQDDKGEPIEIDMSPASPLMNRLRSRAPSLFR